MKHCPFCAEEIQDEAIKCKHCSEFLEERSKGKWYFKTTSVVVAILSLGPLALPLVWWHPTYSRTKKIVISVVVVVLGYYLFQSIMSTINSLSEYYAILS